MVPELSFSKGILEYLLLKFKFSKKATKFDKILTLTSGDSLHSKRQIDREDFVIFCGLLRRHEL